MNLSDQLNKICKLGGKIPFENERLEQDTRDDIIKDLVYCSILPQSAVKTNTPATEGYSYTHRFKFRYKSIPNPSIDMFFIYKKQKYEVKYWEEDFKNSEYLYAYTELKLE